MFSFTIALLFGLAQAAPSQADLRCIVQRVSLTDQAAMVESARREEPSMGPAGDRLMAAAVECGEQLGWDGPRAGQMTALSISLILREGAGRRIAEAGIPAARLDRWFESQSLATRTSVDIGEATSRSLVEALNAEGYALPAIEREGRLIGVYLAARVMIERFERGLSITD